MSTLADLIIHLIMFLLFIILLYGQVRVTSKNSRLMKKISIFMGRFLKKSLAEEFIRICYLSLISIFILIFLFINNDMFLRKIFMEFSFKNLVLIIITFVSFVQILFLIITIWGLIFSNKDINKIIKDIDWLKVDVNMFIYTGYIKPFLVAVFEIMFFFNFIFTVLNEKFKLSLGLSMILTIGYYCCAKYLIRKNKDKQIISIILGFTISLTTLSLINAVNSLIIGLIFMYIILVMIAFKDVKVRL